MKQVFFPTCHEMILSRDDKLVYTLGRQVTVKDRVTGELVDKLAGASNSNGIISQDGKYIAFLSHAGKLKVFETGTPHRLCFEKNLGPRECFGGVAFVDGDRYLLAGVMENIYCFSVKDWKQEIFMRLPLKHYSFKIFAMDDRILIDTHESLGATEPGGFFLYRSFQDASPMMITPPMGHLCKGHLLENNGFAISRRGVDPCIRFFSLDEQVDWDKPLRAMDIPDYTDAFIAPDSKIFTIMGLLENRGAYLYRTEGCELLEGIPQQYPWYDVGFSYSGKYWLVPEDKSRSRVISLSDYD